MKKITLLLATSALLFSCHKTPCFPPVNKPSLIGCWFGSYSSSICFSDSLLSVERDLFFPYSLSSDSVYHIFYDGSKYAQYGYALVNDTLRLYPTLHHPNAPFTYWR